MRRRRSEDDSRFLVIPFFTAEMFSLAQAGREAGIHFSFAELAALAQAGWPAGIGTQNNKQANSSNAKNNGNNCDEVSDVDSDDGSLVQHERVQICAVQIITHNK